MAKYSVLQQFIFRVLRRASVKWPARNAVRTRARRERGLYECADCEGLFGPKEIYVDHINPVIDPIEGFVSWDKYIERLFCEADVLQVLCKPCHKAKTAEENKLRRRKKK